jgi:amino acid adenylation domain-containing protein
VIAFDREEIEGTVGARFRRVVAAQPQARAIGDGATRMSYAELDARSDAYCAGLAGLPQERPVALVFPHGIEAVAALFGALKAGVPAIPVDPMAPPDGTGALLANAQLVVTEPSCAAWCAARAAGVPIHAGPPPMAAPPRPPPGPDSPGVIFYTSASTGAAKGVIRSHRTLLRHAWFLPNRHGYGPGDRVSHLSSFAYAGSVPVIFGGLLSGAAIEVFDIRHRSAADFALWASSQDVTLLQVTPTLLREVVEILQHGHNAWQPRRVTVGGEALRASDVLAMRQQLGWQCPVVNRLASSEAGIIAEWEVDPARIGADGNVPVGWPVSDRRILIADEDGTPLPPGTPGEIVVGGRYLSPGYWQMPEATASRFRPDPDHAGETLLFSGDLGRVDEDGLLEHLGRTDQMVKIRGYRVELGQVEAGLRQVPGVHDAVVVRAHTRVGTDRLLGYVRPAPGVVLNGFAVRAAVGRLLAEYMVPWRILVLDQFPLTAGGKIARQALPQLDTARPAGLPPFVPPQTETERLLAGIWSELFEIDEIGRDDNFVDLGGDSLDVLHVTGELYASLALYLNDGELLDHPTLSGMAEAVDRARGQEA